MVDTSIITQTQILSVFLGDQIFGVPTTSVQDVLRPLNLTAVPSSPDYIKGVSNLRGRIVTAIDLHTRLQHGEVASLESMNVVCENHGELFSLLVDRVGDVLELDDAEIDEPPLTLNTKWRHFSLGVHQLDHALMIILDPEKLLQSENE